MSENQLDKAGQLLLAPSGLSENDLQTVLDQLMGHAVDSADLYFQLTRHEAWVLEDGIVKEGSHNIEQGVVVMGYGTFAKVSLHWVRDNKFPAGNKYDNWEGGIELMSLNGMIVDGAPHIHFTASDPNGAFGGHMEEGCICYVLCEVAIVELEGVHMTRESVPIVKDSEGNPVNLPQLKFS